MSPRETSGERPARSLGAGTLLLAFWQLLRVGMQALWMLIVARLLGAAGYGSFAGYAGLSAALGSLTGLGFGLTLLQDVSRDRASFGRSLRHATRVAVASGVLLWFALLVIADPLLHGGLRLYTVACIGIPEVLAFPLTILCSYAYQAHDRPGMAGLMYGVIPLSNLFAVALFLAASAEHSLSAYAPYHAVTACLGTIVAWSIMRGQLRPPMAQGWPQRRDVEESLGFSMMRVIDAAMTSLDKSLVLRLAGAEIAGWYTAAFRLASVLAIPASALAMAALPRLFRTRDRGSARQLALTLLLGSLISGALATLGMMVGAAALPWLLGPAFQGAATAAHYLIFTPLLIGLAGAGANVLATSNRRRWRVLAQATGLIGLYVLGVLIIPRYGLAGAAVMLQGALAVVALFVWLAVFLLPQRTQPEPESVEIKS